MNQKITRPLTAFFLLLLLAAQSCRTTKETAAVDNGSAPTTTERLVGTISKSEECGFCIDVIQGDVMRTYYPVNLEDKYKQDGLKVKFAWEKSKVNPPSECLNMIVVSVSDVTPLR